MQEVHGDIDLDSKGLLTPVCESVGSRKQQLLINPPTYDVCTCINGLIPLLPRICVFTPGNLSHQVAWC